MSEADAPHTLHRRLVSAPREAVCPLRHLSALFVDEMVDVDWQQIGH
jgi:hypothetical protein